jgi:hypothetical protein
MYPREPGLRFRVYKRLGRKAAKKKKKKERKKEIELEKGAP